MISREAALEAVRRIFTAHYPDEEYVKTREFVAGTVAMKWEVIHVLAHLPDAEEKRPAEERRQGCD